MKPILADVNVWLATLVAEHPHHEAATGWWRDVVVPAGDTVALCRLTQLGLLRLLTNERVMGRRRLDHTRAWSTVAGILGQGRVTFLAEPNAIDEHLEDLSGAARSSPAFWSDAYLVAFARAGQLRLATFDRGFRRFDRLDLLLLTG